MDLKTNLFHYSNMTIHSIKRNVFLREAIFFLSLFVLFHFLTHVSLLFQVDTGWSKIYFPTVIGIALVHWFGPRVLVPLYLNSSLSAGLWGMPNIILYPVYALPELTIVFLSWWIFNKLYKGKCWLPDIKNLISFFTFAVVIPVTGTIVLHEILFYFIPDISRGFNPEKTLNILLAEFLTIITVCIPLLYFFSSHVSRLRTSVIYKKPVSIYSIHSMKSKGELARVVSLILALVVLNFLIDYIDYWFVYGLLAIFIAVKRGFSFSIMANFAIFINGYVIYFLFFIDSASSSRSLEGENTIYLGLSLLFVATYIIGRVISDNSNTNLELERRNYKLKKVNEELDRFVYSVSHDLSSPLKSIKGLVNLASAEQDKEMLQKYLYHINKSTVKLDAFIKEVLDFSRSTRAELIIKKSNLEELLKNCLSSFEYQDEYEHIDISYELSCKEFYTDELRFKIILNNLISNAIKYRNKDVNGSFLKISSRARGNMVLITFQDNGLGMEKDVQKKIFDLFYRGNVQSTGSGLGLYIVKEALAKLEGKISVNSKPGIGSTFIVELPMN